MARKSFARRTQRTIVGAAKSSAASVQKNYGQGCNRCGDRCRPSRRRIGHSVDEGPRKPDAETRGEKAVCKKQNEDGQDRAKEKTLDTRPPVQADWWSLGMLHRAIVACQAYSVSADIRDELLHAANNVTGINNKTLLRCSR
jgi:hypothetical protein